MILSEADKIANRLKKAADIDSAKHGCRNTNDVLDSAPILYFDIVGIVEAYRDLREQQKLMHKLLEAVKEAGEAVDFY